MLRAGTSVVAHVREASRARSDAEFVSKLGGSIQEADELDLWLEPFRNDFGSAAKKHFHSSKVICIHHDQTTIIDRTYRRGA